ERGGPCKARCSRCLARSAKFLMERAIVRLFGAARLIFLVHPLHFRIEFSLMVVIEGQRGVNLGHRKMRVLKVNCLRPPLPGDAVNGDLDYLHVGIVNPRSTFGVKMNMRSRCLGHHLVPPSGKSSSTTELLSSDVQSPPAGSVLLFQIRDTCHRFVSMPPASRRYFPRMATSGTAVDAPGRWCSLPFCRRKCNLRWASRGGCGRRGGYAWRALARASRYDVWRWRRSLLH